MDTKTIWIFVGIIIVIAIGIAVIYNVQPSIAPGEGEISQPGTTVGRGLAGLPVGSAEWENPKEPMQSPPLKDNEIPKTAIKIGISSAGFSPETFKVKTGQKIILALTSKDESAHVFKFEDESLNNLAVGLNPGETRTIIFFAPKKTGNYEFFCDVPGHSARGEEGKMIVK